MDYLIYNSIREPQNRFLRAQVPGTRGLKQYIMQNKRRIVSSRPARITEDELMTHLEEFKQKNKMGLIRVTTMDGRAFDLETLTASPTLPSPPLPNPPMDSISRDAPAGTVMGRFQDAPPPQEYTMPVEPPPAALEEPLPELAGGLDTNSKSGDAGSRKGKIRR